MLKNIPAILSPELLKVLAEMGHGDEIVLADANFPGATMAQRLVRMDGHPMPPILRAILQLLPLDDFVERPAMLMAVAKGDSVNPAIWKEYEAIIRDAEPCAMANGFEMIERFAFYERSKKAYAVVQSGEGALYANIILKKGVIPAVSPKI
jgi:L-fucose mutarotase